MIGIGAVHPIKGDVKVSCVGYVGPIGGCVVRVKDGAFTGDNHNGIAPGDHPVSGIAEFLTGIFRIITLR